MNGFISEMAQDRAVVAVERKFSVVWDDLYSSSQYQKPLDGP